jgi:hypothetical protein
MSRAISNPFRRTEVEDASAVQPASAEEGVPTSSRRAIGSGVVESAQPVANLPGIALAPSPQAAPPAQFPMAYQHAVPVYAGTTNQVPLAMGPAQRVNYEAFPRHHAHGGAGMAAGPMDAGMGMGMGPVPGAGGPMPMHLPGSGVGIAPARYDHPNMPGYAWPSYAAYPNYAAVTYPKQYSPTAWPYIGPFYPYPQVPLGWRKVTLEWDDGWWFLDFKDRRTMYNK